MTQRHGEVRFVAEITAEPERIWLVIRRFGDVANWNPIASTSRLVAGIDGVPGAERELLLVDGTTVRERLIEIDEGKRHLEYEMLSFPIPLTEQRNRIVVSASTPGGSLVTFTARFLPMTGTTIDEIAAINRSAFTSAAAGIGRLLNVDSHAVV